MKDSKMNALEDIQKAIDKNNILKFNITETMDYKQVTVRYKHNEDDAIDGMLSNNEIEQYKALLSDDK